MVHSCRDMHRRSPDLLSKSSLWKPSASHRHVTKAFVLIVSISVGQDQALAAVDSGGVKSGLKLLGSCQQMSAPHKACLLSPDLLFTYTWSSGKVAPLTKLQICEHQSPQKKIKWPEQTQCDSGTQLSRTHC